MKSSRERSMSITGQDRHNLDRFFDLLHKWDQKQNKEVKNGRGTANQTGCRQTSQGKT